ncbi:MAG: ATP-dependent DNA helicase [Candidatus Aenigmatarchaeota archaeon]
MRFFPYTPRKYQEKVIELIQREIEGNKNICIHATSGFGKTISILSALLPYVESSGIRIIWAVKTGNQTDRPIEELKIINKKCASGFFGFSFRGKKDMCLLGKKYGKNLTYDDIHYICKHMQGECKYAKNINKFKEIEEKILKQPLCYSEILKICKKYNICPYKIQYIISEFADIISANYNYILNDFEMLPITDDRPKILVVDEAHNLQNINIKSFIISYKTLKKAFGELEDFFENKNKKIFNFLKEFEEYINSISNKFEEEIEINKQEILTLCNNEILEELKEYGMAVRAERLRSGKPPRSSIYRLYLFFSAILASINQDGIVLIAFKDKGKENKQQIYFEVFDMRAEEVLKEKWENYNARIFCSGTLTPIDAFADICGLENYSSCQIPSIYTSKNILPLITNGLTTKGAELEEKMKKAYVENILKFVKNLQTNIAIFCASYRIQNNLIEEGLVERINELNREVFVEESKISGIEGREILIKFKKKSKDKNKAVLIAPLGGRFGEGVDFPNGELGGIYIVGIPFDKICARTNAYLNYYKSLYGPSLGRYYGYILPALKKASQAIGRGLRSENDRCIVILGDQRFAEPRFFKLLPDYVRYNAKIINYEEIDKNIEEFKL